MPQITLFTVISLAASRPHGQVRRSQLITSFGPGSMMDLPNHSVLISGLDSWSTGGDEIIEPRLVAKLKELFDPPLQVLKLYTPPPDNDDPTSPQTGITAWQFPEWFITQDVDSDHGHGAVRARMLVHRRMLTKGKFIDDSRKKRSVVPVRFVRACRNGHIGDLDWYEFVHGSATDCRRPLWIEERGTSGDLSEVWVRCECGKGERSMAQAAESPQSLGRCDGNRADLFSEVTNQLTRIYRDLMPLLIEQALPLVIVDEAHNWKNGPKNGSNGYKDFSRLLTGRVRRALLMTATPFQLRPEELLEILKVGDLLQPCPNQDESEIRRCRLQAHSKETISQILKPATHHARGFSKAWSKLPSSVTTDALANVWTSPPIANARAQLDKIARRPGVVSTNDVEQVIDAAVSDVTPDVRHLIREGLRVFTYNHELSHELGALVIRHRRLTGHRHFRVGAEYQSHSNGSTNRTDRHVLHAAPGVNVQGDGELPHYLLMRCVSEMKGGKGRSSLGSALTGCYSTLIDSAEGRGIRTRLENTPIGKVYLKLLMEMVNAKHDPKHPKVREVVEAVIANWRAGEKTLIFCFRTHTAKRLHEIIDGRIRKELSRQRERCMGGPESLTALRKRLTGKDRDLVVLGMDRVLWSVLWCDDLNKMARRSLVPDDLELRDDELTQVALIGLRHGVDLLSERVDRVFLHRATEFVIARRWIREIGPGGLLKDLLSAIASESWVCGPYGLSASDSEDDSGADTAHFDERGIHSVYLVEDEITELKAAAISRELLERRTRARKQGQTAVLDLYERGPNLWLGANPRLSWEQQRNGESSQSSPTIRQVHEKTLALTVADGVLDWKSRRATFQAIRRAVLRESMLLRLLPSEQEREESGWGELLVEKFFSPLPKQRESTADHIAVFLEDLVAASGNISDQNSARFAFYDATRLRDQQFVALVSGVHGSKDKQTRERVFAGFNTPLLPEVLICTSVGQEGIDLHRHCRHVVHFDLAWNPAVMEQRTGRTDRIGSKTFRERAINKEVADSFLEIGVPYLAGTYDERMYEELRLRAQTFEVLTGGDLTADEAEGNDHQHEAEGEEAGIQFVPLPGTMVEAMRVSFHVWAESM